MGVIWYFEILSWYTGGNWAMFFDCINMLQVRVMHLLFWYNVYNAGSLGVHNFRVQAERGAGAAEEEGPAVLHRGGQAQFPRPHQLHWKLKWVLPLLAAYFIKYFLRNHSEN